MNGSRDHSGCAATARSAGRLLMARQNSRTAVGLVIQFRNSQAASWCRHATGMTKTLPLFVVVRGRPPGGAGSGKYPQSRVGAYRRICVRAHSPVSQMAILPTKKGPFGV